MQIFPDAWGCHVDGVNIAPLAGHAGSSPIKVIVSVITWCFQKIFFTFKATLTIPLASRAIQPINVGHPATMPQVSITRIQSHQHLFVSNGSWHHFGAFSPELNLNLAQHSCGSLDPVLHFMRLPLICGPRESDWQGHVFIEF